MLAATLVADVVVAVIVVVSSFVAVISAVAAVISVLINRELFDWFCCTLQWHKEV